MIKKTKLNDISCAECQCELDSKMHDEWKPLDGAIVCNKCHYDNKYMKVQSQLDRLEKLIIKAKVEAEEIFAGNSACAASLEEFSRNIYNATEIIEDWT